MIKVEKDLHVVPQSIVNNTQNHNTATIKAMLKDIYNSKCCYCEKEIESAEIEHYRPKSIYDWLYIEWSNLLWSCVACNRGTGGKSDKFPITGTRIITCSGNLNDRRSNSSYLQAEGALLIHPEIEDPELHLTVLYDGKLQPIDNSAKGQATIETCNLNRDFLQKSKRKKIIDSICDELKDQLFITIDTIEKNPDTNKKEVLLNHLGITFKKIIEGKSSTHEFSLVYRVFEVEFSTFVSSNTILDELPIWQREIIIQTFDAYKQAQKTA